MIYCSPAERRETEEGQQNKKRDVSHSAESITPHEKVAPKKVEEMWKGPNPGTLAKVTCHSSGKTPKMTQKQGVRSDITQVSPRMAERS